MSRLPLVTLGITAFNAALSIERAVRSAHCQTWPSKEIVVVDDGSTDGTWTLLEKLSSEIPMLRVYRQETNGGVARARNLIIRHARGRFVAFFDDDDVSHPERVARQYDRIVAYETAYAARLIICHAVRKQIWPDGHTRLEPTMGCVQDRPAPHGTRVAERILIGRVTRDIFGSCATCSQMARKEVYETAAGFDESLRRNEDTDLNIRLALAGCHFPGIADPLVTQYISPTRDKHVEIERANQFRLIDKHRAYLESRGWYAFCRAWTEAKFDYLAGNRGRFVPRFLTIAVRYPIKTALRLYWVWPNWRYNRRLGHLLDSLSSSETALYS